MRLLLLHGLGSVGADMINMTMAELSAWAQKQGIPVVAPDAPDRKQHKVCSFPTRAWFDYDCDPLSLIPMMVLDTARPAPEIDADNTPDIEQEFADAVAFVRTYIVKDTIIVGHSQGAMLALRVAIEAASFPEAERLNLLGVVASHGTLIKTPKLTCAAPELVPPILIIGDYRDAIITGEVMKEGRANLDALGVSYLTVLYGGTGSDAPPVHAREYHSPSREEEGQIAGYVRELLLQTRSASRLA